MLVGFMGYREFNIFNRSESVKQQVLSGKKVAKEVYPGRKGGLPFYSLVGGDGLLTLRNYLEHERGPIRPGEALIINQIGRPLSWANVHRTFNRIAIECGIIEQKTPRCLRCGGKTRKKFVWSRGPSGRKGKTHYICLECGHAEPAYPEYRGSKSTRYGVNPHELRDLAKTLWYTSGTNEKWMADFFSGRTHQVDPNNYLKAMKHYPDWMEDVYLKVLPWLNVLSEDPKKVPARDFRQV